MGNLDRLIIHIGMPKTGSSAIQETLAANRILLREQLVHYPQAATRGNAHHPVAWSASLQRRPRDDVKSLPATLDALDRELRDAEGTAILSSEALFHLPAPELQPIVDWTRARAETVMILVYVRPPAAFHEGWYRQLVKTSAYDLSFEDHLGTAPIVDTLARLESAESLAGVNRLAVRPYLRHEFANRSVVDDFLTVVGIDSQALRLSRADANPSLDAELVQLKVRLHQLGVVHTPRLANSLLDWTSLRPPSVRSLFTPETWDDFSHATADKHAIVMQRYELPDELRDVRPSQMGGWTLSEIRFRELLAEFRERYPATAKESLDELGLPTS